MMSVCWRVVSLKPLRFWSSDSYRAALSPDVFDDIFPRITGVFSHWYMRNKTHLNSERKKKSLLSLVKRQWPFRSSQYKRKIWSLVKRIKLPHPSKAKRECHKSVNNPRRHLVDLTIYLGLSEKSVCGSLRWVLHYSCFSHSAQSPKATQHASGQNIISYEVNRKEDYLTDQIPKRFEGKIGLVVQYGGNKDILKCWVPWYTEEIPSWSPWSELAFTCPLFNYNIVLKIYTWSANILSYCILFFDNFVEIYYLSFGFPKPLKRQRKF